MLPVPAYLQEFYWWAYVHPWAVRTFERDWLVNLILFGNYARLRDAALAEIGCPASGRTLQVACVYGDLTVRLSKQIAEDGVLDVVDVMPIQLQNLARKLPRGSKARLLHRDSTALGIPDASYDQVLIFFLLHEQPLAVRRRTLAEAIRVVKPGGKIVLVDYHQPRRGHPLRQAMRAVAPSRAVCAGFMAKRDRRVLTGGDSPGTDPQGNLLPRPLPEGCSHAVNGRLADACHNPRVSRLFHYKESDI